MPVRGRSGCLTPGLARADSAYVSDRKALAREIAARAKPRLIDTNLKRPQTVEDCKALARKIAAAKPPRFISIPLSLPWMFRP